MKRIGIVLLAVFFSVFQTEAREAKGVKRKSGPTPNPGIAANCSPATAAAELSINNTRALIQSGGDMWWDFNASRYEIPQGSGRTSLFAGSLWLGGQDVAGQLKVAALRFRQVGNDYWTGPLSTVTSEISAETCRDYDRHFASTRDDITTFVAWFNAGIADAEDGTNTQQEDFPGYQRPRIIDEWPAHGRNFDPFNEDFNLAPFIDLNGDGFYNPNDGDYPAYDLTGEADCRQKVVNLFGDENLWWVFNDKGNIHTETGGEAIGMEIRAQAFAFATNDEVNNMTFYNYELINRSTFTLTETFFGQWVDGDLGCAQDDYVGCDVQRGLGYFFNGFAIDADCGGQLGYGENPPAIGIDFFQGPFQDNDGLDNPGPTSENGFSVTFEEAFNNDGIPYRGIGVGYGDGIIDNERFGMRKFVFHNNGGANPNISDPNTAVDYYNYLRSIWLDGSRMKYGGDGHDPGNPTAIDADYMFPGDTDPIGWGTGGVPQEPWTEVTAGNTPLDRRFAQSAGPFTLAPGAVNNITVGVVWARASSGGPAGSVAEVRRADDKTQALFDNCFRILNGPDAPDLEVQELDRELILYLSNPQISNNFNEEYEEVSPFLIPADSVDTDNNGTPDTPLTDEERRLYATYRFQGYQIYQLVDGTVGADELLDPDRARLVTQVDIEDDIRQLVNFTFSEDLGGNIPSLRALDINNGIQHSFRVTEDLFATGDRRLINHRQYYFMAIAYGYNKFGDDFGNLVFIEEDFDPRDPSKLNGQKEPFLGSRKAATGAIRPAVGIPHDPQPETGGTAINAQYGDGVPLLRIEGQGNGGSPLLIRQAEIDAMMAAGETAEIPWVVRNPVYEAGAGPATIKVIDPLNVRGGSYTLRMLDTVTLGLDLGQAHWELTGGSLLDDTLTADRSIAIGNEQLIPELGISIEIEQVAQPGDAGSSNNGLIGGSITFANPRAQWLSGVADQDGNDFQNWIRSGTSDDPDSDDFDDWPGLDPEQDYEGILGGTWAPFRLTASHTHGPIANDIHAVVARLDRLQSVSIFITNDRSKWSRVPVLEMQDVENLAQGGTGKGFLRSARSVDKNGNPADSGAVGQDQVEDLATYIGATGMGWFPGYAINLETGERLNMAFGEDSWLAAENGQDMLWNPTSSVVEQLFREVRFGGKHYVYVFRNNSDLGDDQMPGYDAGKFMHDILINANAPVEPEVRNIWSAAMWVGLPLVAEGETLLDNDVVVDLLVGKPYSTQVFKRFTDSYLTPNSSLTAGRYYYVNSGPVFHEGDTFMTGQSFVAQSNTFTAQVGLDNLLETQNGGLPLYNFSLDGLQVINNDNALLDDALEDINIVPNPYYAFSDYEADALDNRVRIINLPRVANVNIYTVNGTLVRAFKKDDPTITSLDWDLKNTANIPIASGVYIVHVEVPGVGEKILKWFGLARTIDLDSF